MDLKLLKKVSIHKNSKNRPLYETKVSINEVFQSVRMVIFFLLIFLLFIPHQTVLAQSLDKLNSPIVTLRIIETTDLHGYIFGYDYKNQKETFEYGFARTATLIQRARNEVEQSLLFDVGDAIVGSAMAKHVYKSQLLRIPDIHPVYNVMNLLQYDAATLGNHEFNYGLDFLLTSLKSAQFPIVCSNIVIDDVKQFSFDKINFFHPYHMIKKEVTDTNGNKHVLNIGVLGLITPVTAIWDYEHFQGKLKIKNITETAEQLVPVLKSKGADVIIALVHAGLEADKDLKSLKGNSVIDLSRVKGIDAILYGHSHKLFPNSNIKSDRKEINFVTGTINGIPSIQAGKWGNHIGIIDLTLQKNNDNWEIIDYQTSLKSIYKTVNGKNYPVIPMDKKIIQTIRKLHEETVQSVKDGFIKVKK